jgi:hypothetical protein
MLSSASLESMQTFDTQHAFGEYPESMAPMASMAPKG